MSKDILGSLARVLKTVPPNRQGLVKDFARKLAGKDGHEWERKGKIFLRKEESCTRLISGAETLTLDPTDGAETLANAKDLFTGGLDEDFENYGTNVPSPATGKMKVTVHEMIKDGDFKAIFGGLNDDLDKLCLTQAQIIQFVKKHRKWLRTEGYTNFFLFKIGNEFFVAYVYVRSGGELEVYVRHFWDDGVWHAECRPRVVVPLPLAN